MKNAAVLLVLFVGFYAAAEFNTMERPFECPLRVQTSALGVNEGFDIEIEALTFFLEQETPGVCKSWTEKVRRLRDKLISFHERTIQPLPVDLLKEAENLSKGLATVLVESAQALIDGKNPCSQGALNEESREALAALVRTLYASNENLRRMARVGGGTLKLAKSLEQAVTSVMNSVKEQLAFNEKKAQQRAEKFTNTACEWLEMEQQVRCKHRTAPANYQTKLKEVRQTIQKQAAVVAASTRFFLGSQTFMDRLKGLVKRKKEVAGEEAFSHYVVPALRLCEVEQSLAAHGNPAEEQSAEFVARCGHLLCEQLGMLPNGRSPRVTPGHFESAFCDFTQNYRRVEGMYHQAFDEIVSAGTGTGKPISTPFCPSKNRAVAPTNRGAEKASSSPVHSPNH